MSYAPDFMSHFHEFAAERQRVSSMEEWLVFSRRWFNHDHWPEKTAEQLAKDSRTKQSPVRLGGRLWAYTSYRYDLTPDARYELFATISDVGDPIRFPHIYDIPKTPGSRWSQICPACEISTNDIGSDQCPKCHRRLLFKFTED
jgi:hypothetical protein